VDFADFMVVFNTDLCPLYFLVSEKGLIRFRSSALPSSFPFFFLKEYFTSSVVMVGFFRPFISVGVAKWLYPVSSLILARFTFYRKG